MSADSPTIEQQLTESLASGMHEGRFSPEKFMRTWFWERGRAYFFLFKKNLRVTNIQFAELFALLRSYAKVDGSDPQSRDLQFLSGVRFHQVLKEIDRSFPRRADAVGDRAALIGRLYGRLLQTTVVVECFQGSCAVYLPPSVEIDLLTICAYSGYIHSCGPAVYVRAANETTLSTFVSSVGAHLGKNVPAGKKAFFAVYAHEDFSKFDRAVEGELRDGLDDVKIHVEKFYMGEYRLVQVLQEMRRQLDGRITIPEPGNYKQHGDFRRQAGVDLSRTLWLISDRPAAQDVSLMGPDRYFICYDQLYSNENPFHVFDENKPAWKAHTTIPHTLAGAMINLTRPWWPRDHCVAVVDPFVGTGTTCFEAVKFPETCTAGSDIDHCSSLLAQDNLTFFGGAPEDIEQHYKAMSLLADCLDDKGSLTKSPETINEQIGEYKVSDAYGWSAEMMTTLQTRKEAESEDLSEETVRDLSKAPLFYRLFFYLARRATIRYAVAFERGSHDFVTAFCKEAASLCSQMKELLKKRRAEYSGVVEARGHIVVYQGTYSNDCGINSKYLRDLASRFNDSPLVTRCDAQSLKAGSCDVIIADPPYGFNTEESPADLAQIYSDCLDSMIRALKDEGQIVLCLLDRSHTGRQSLFFTNKELIIQQVLVKAEAAGYEVIMPAGRVPEPVERFRPPYYWESVRALRRAILHFRLRRRC